MSDPVPSGIIPDTKNWTWVLERRCNDCGFDASTFDPTRTGSALRLVTDAWVTVLSTPGMATRTREGFWSPLEYGCHVRDVYRRFHERLDLMLDSVDPAFENWDQDATAREDRYDLQDPATVSDELRQSGFALGDRFDSVRPDQWERRGFRSDGSVFTVGSLARYLMHDPVHHLWDVGAVVPDP
jgi:hypothetical protein